MRLGGLDWLVTYVSTDASGDLIATLWLTNNFQDAWGERSEALGEYYGLLAGGLFGDWSADWYSFDTSLAAPSNLYGSSYIRAETLNNASSRSVATQNGTTVASAQSTEHLFSLYTVASLGLTNYLATPSEMPWINALQDPAGRSDPLYYYNNESLTTTDAYGYSGEWYPSTSNYSTYSAYTNWQNDYLWLPSLAEIGSGSGANGLWQCNDAERLTLNGTTASVGAFEQQLGSQNTYSSSTAYLSTWTRSARPGPGAYACTVGVTGSDSSDYDVQTSCAVRPCLLLNLTAAAKHIAG